MGTRMSRKIYNACSDGDFEKVRDCLENPETNKQELLSEQFTFEYKRTLLHVAALKGHNKIVKLLLVHGADVNCKTRHAGDYTPLHLAVHGKHISCVEELLQHDKIDVIAKDGILTKTAYQHAIEMYPKDSPIPVLLKSAEVIQAAKSGDDKVLTKILQGINKPEISDDCFSQALLEAVSNQQPNLDVIKTVLMYASKCQHTCNSLEIESCLRKIFHSNSVNVKLAGLLLVYWTARNNQSQEPQELGYFLGTATVQWEDLQSDDIMLNELIYEHPELIQAIRNELKELKCANIAPAITMAITCNYIKAAQLLLTHGSLPLNEQVYHVDWKNLQLSSLPPKVLECMYHRRQFSGKGLEWNQITHIDLRNNGLVEVPVMIFKLPLLTTLYLSRNKIKSLPDVKKVSASLNHMYLSNNMLKDLPKSYGRSNLRTLKLDHNHFEHIPDCVCYMVALETLDVSSNMITVLPLELGRLSKLITFGFDKERISLPQDWVSNCRNTQELIQWLRSLLLKAKPFKTVKLLVIGWEGKGKTTLVHRLRDDFEYNRDINQRTMTRGVEVSQMEMQKAIGGIVPLAGSRITFQVWDFAGQKDFHLMHMCFLPSIGLYILLWNLVDGAEGVQKMKDWLDNIARHETTKATVIIVGSHLDCIKERFKNNKDEISQYIEEMRRDINNMASVYNKKKVCIADVVEVSCNVAASCAGIKDLKKKIVKASQDVIRGKDVRVLDEPVPGFFHEMVKCVQNLRSSMCKDNSVPIINRDKMKSLLMETSGNKDIIPKEYEEVVAFLKDRGVILQFNDRDLRDFYFIDPRWLFSIMSQVICPDKNDDGFLRSDQLFKDVQEISFTQHTRQLGIRLLSRFQLVHCLDSEYLLVPSRFPESPPAAILCGANADERTALRRLYKMDPVPPGLFSRLIARLLHYLENMICEVYRDDQTLPSWSGTPVISTKTPLPSISFSTSSSATVPATALSSTSSTTNQSTSSPRLSGCPAEPSSSWLPPSLNNNQLQGSNWSLSNLKECNKVHWWRNGLHLNLNDLIVKVELNEGNEIQIRTSSGPGLQMMTLIDEHFDTLVGEWYQGIKVTKCLPCVVCERMKLETKHTFKMDECLDKLEQAKDLLCPFHEEKVSVRDIAPDICLNDIHHHLLFEHQHLHYDEKSLINEGNFGKVYRAVLKKPDGACAVAVKQFKGDQLTSFNELRKEINILRRINHPNLVQMIGVALNVRCVAFEIAQYGSLDDILFDTPRTLIPRLVIVTISREIAAALEQLHRLSIVHRDLKPGNVLVFSLKEQDRVHVKVTDFGTASFVGPSGMQKFISGTHIKAPEVLQLDCKEDCGIQVDIYSFAILLYSLISRKRAFDQLSPMKVRTYVLQHKRPAWRHVREAMCTFINLTRLMCVAWHPDPRHRPTSEQCCLQLQNPGFQLLMSKFAFSSSCIVYMVRLVSNKELLVVHRTCGLMYVSMFCAQFNSTQSKHDYLISMPDGVVVEACSSSEKVVVLLRENSSSNNGIFRMFSLHDYACDWSVECAWIPATINGMALSRNMVFVTTNDGCFTASLNELSSTTLQRITYSPSKSIVLSTDYLWLSCEKKVIRYSLLNDFELQYSTSINVSGVRSMQYYGSTVWALTRDGLTNLNQHDSVNIKNTLLSSFAVTYDAVWLGLTTGDISIMSLSTFELIATFRAHSGPVEEMMYCPENDNHPPIVISYGKVNSHNLGQDDVILPLSVDSSEIVKLTNCKPSRKSCSYRNDCDSNWETVDDIGDHVLLAWQAVSCQSLQTVTV